MLHLQITKAAAVKIAKKGFGALYAGAMILPYVQEAMEFVRKAKPVEYNYDYVISAVLNSSMLSSDKVEVAGKIAQGKDEEYYKAVVEVINSSMLGSYKKEMIDLINK